MRLKDTSSILDPQDRVRRERKGMAIGRNRQAPAGRKKNAIIFCHSIGVFI